MTLVHRHRTRVAALFAAVFAGSVGLAACGQLLGIPGETEVDLSEGGVGPQGGEGGPLTAEGSTNTDGPVASETGACVGVDFKTNKANCGRCGHDCLGGDCQASTCQPFSLADNQGRPVALAVDDKYVFWNDQRDLVVRRVDKYGNNVTPLAAGLNDLQGIAADGEYVYWGIEDFPSPGGVWRKPRTAAVDEPAQQIAQADHVWDVKLFKGRLYFTAWNEQTVRSIDLDGGAPKLIAQNITQVRHVAVDDSFAYYTSYQSNVYQVPLDGGDAEVPIGPQDYGVDIATDGVRVAWGDSHPNGTGDLHLWAATLNAGLSVVTASGPVVPPPSHVRDAVAVAIDQDRIYFTFVGAGDGAANGYLGCCPKSGCEPTGPVFLAKAINQPTAIVLDESAVYYATYEVPGSAKIWKVAKP